MLCVFVLWLQQLIFDKRAALDLTNASRTADNAATNKHEPSFSEVLELHAGARGKPFRSWAVSPSISLK